MGFFSCLLCVTFAQIAFGQVAPYTGPNAVNTGQKQVPFIKTYSVGLGPNQQITRSDLNGVPDANQFVRNMAISGNGLANDVNVNLVNANANIASAYLANANPNVNFSPNLASGNYYANPNFVNTNNANQNFANNIASPIQAVSYANLGHTDSNAYKFINTNYLSSNLARPDLANQLYPYNLVDSIAPINLASPGNIASLTNAANMYYGNFNFANNPNPNYAGLNIANNPNPNYAGLNIANNPNPNYAGLNIANSPNPNYVALGGNVGGVVGNNLGNGNIATGAATGNQGNGLTMGAFNLGSNPNYSLIHFANGQNPSYAGNQASDLLGYNLANTNTAKGAVAGNHGNGLTMGALNLVTDSNSFQLFNGSPDSQPFGIHITADTLEVGGTVSVTGKMPIYGTVSLNGNLPTDGAASVNYGCTSPRNV